jgi:hypothetical protein
MITPIETPLEGATNIAAGFKKALDIALRDKEIIEKEHESQVFKQVYEEYQKEKEEEIQRLIIEAKKRGETYEPPAGT